MPETCNSRSLSWLVKSCIPDPRREIAKQQPGNHHHYLRPASAVAAAASPISSLPDDLLLECLSRVPHSALPSLSLVCRRFSFLLDSPAFLHLRRSNGRLHPTLHALSLLDLGLLASATLPIGSPSAAWEISAASLAVPPGIFLDGSFSHVRPATVGRSIYLIGRGATLKYDTWTGAISHRAPTIFPRKKFAAATIGGKIYVSGGAARTSAVEEYDPEKDAWRVVAEAPRRRYGCVGAAAGGVFYVIGGLRIGGAQPEGGRRLAHACAGSMDAYHVRAGTWLRARAAAVVPGGGCVVGACGAGAHVYVLASHAVEVTFWRWEGSAGRRGGDNWSRLEPPPVPGQVRMGGAVRFCCAAVGDSKVVSLVHVSGGGDGAARRGGGWVLDSEMDGAVLVYDIACGQWSRGPDLPTGYRRAACGCVES